MLDDNPPEISVMDSSEKNNLRQTWELTWSDQIRDDPNPPDIVLPEEIEEPTVPSIDETELGRIRQRNFQNSLNGIAGYTAAQLQQLQEQLNEMRNVEAHPV